MSQALTASKAEVSPRGSKTGRMRSRSGFLGFWSQFFRRPYGVVGLALLAVYVILAVAAPWLTPYRPSDTFLADRLAAPSWAGIFPRFRGVPPTKRLVIPASDWKATGLVAATVTRQKVENNGEATVINLSPEATGSASADLSWTLSYPYDPPKTFEVNIPYAVEAPWDASTSLSFKVVDPSGTEHVVWEKTVYGSSDWKTQKLDSRDYTVKMALGLSFFDDPAQVVFAERGDYHLALHVESSGGSAPVRVTVGEVGFNVLGLLHGILGTDHMGADLWTQLLYGARISLIIGIVAAIMAVAIGTAIGLISGYMGGAVDEFLMRMADVFLSVPTLPILIILSAFFGKNLGNIIILVAAFAWMGTARVVRSQTLSLKQRAFVESARAAGASDGYIMVTHLLPNVFPLVVANAVLMMPVAILYEASLSFLGLGDPRIPTWGRMLQNARAFGAFTEFAWWWLIPPGLAITLLSLSFTLIGNAVNEVLNPRYRERA